MSVRFLNFRRAWTLLAAGAEPFLMGLLLVCAIACTRQVGDACTTNVDCSPLGDRFCDLSSPEGYCTVEGCDSLSCPSGSVCVAFFSLQRGTPVCSPGRDPRPDCTGGSDCCKPGTPGCCRLGERCLCDDAGCAKSFCASETSEHRWCMHPCESDSDCRTGYQCYTTNQGGTSAVASRTDAGLVEVPVLSYCAPMSAK